MTYEEFLQAKKIEVKPSGFEPEGINPMLFDFQKGINVPVVQFAGEWRIAPGWEWVYQRKIKVRLGRK